MEPFLGQIILVGFNYAPTGWAFCRGQLLPISSNAALFSLLGISYGGDGQTTFRLPDLRGRVPIGFDQGPGLSSYSLGQIGGQEQVTLLHNELPHHNHSLNANSTVGTEADPNGKTIAQGEVLIERGNIVPANSFTSAAPNTQMDTQSIGFEGGGQPHANMQPYMALNYIIATQGIYPPRN